MFDTMWPGKIFGGERFCLSWLFVMVRMERVFCAGFRLLCNDLGYWENLEIAGISNLKVSKGGWIRLEVYAVYVGVAYVNRFYSRHLVATWVVIIVLSAGIESGVSSQFTGGTAWDMDHGVLGELQARFSVFCRNSECRIAFDAIIPSLFNPAGLLLRSVTTPPASFTNSNQATWSHGASWWWKYKSVIPAAA